MTYPNAIIKQADHQTPRSSHTDILQILPLEITQKKPSNDECDFSLSFNINNNLQWYFGSGEIGQMQGDFKLAAAKYITKGLGFMSNLVEQEVGGRSYIVPRKYYENNPSEMALSYMSPLDKYTFAVYNGKFKEPLSKVFGLFEKTGLYSQYDSSFKPNERQISNYYAVGSRLAGIESFEFTIDGETVRSQGREDFEFIPNSPNFLMHRSSSFSFGTRLTDAINKHGSLYGPFILRVLQEVGYATPTNPQVIQFADS